jgi:hypothetical protein
MDALVAAIAQILDYIHTQGPDAIAQLMVLLEALKAGAGYVEVGAGYVAALFGLVTSVPAVIEIISQLIALISSGAGVTEIATAIGSLAGSLGLSIEAVIHILQIIGAFLLAF